MMKLPHFRLSKMGCRQSKPAVSNNSIEELPEAGEASSTTSSGMASASNNNDVVKSSSSGTNNSNSKKPISDATTADDSILLTLEDIRDARGNADTIRDLCGSCTDDADFLENVLEPALDLCRQYQRKVNASIASNSSVVDLEVLHELKSDLADAIKKGEDTMQKSFAKLTTTTNCGGGASAASAAADDDNIPGNLSIPHLVEEKDVFSLICLLRARREETRMEAALALMRFLRDAEIFAGEYNYAHAVREEIRAQGGMQLFVNLFSGGDNESTGTSHELKVVAALAVAYLLPTFVVHASTLPDPSFGSQIIECFNYLCSATAAADAESVTFDGRERMTKEEFCRASASGLNALWINLIEPMLTSDNSRGPSDGETLVLFSTLGGSSSSDGPLFDQATAEVAPDDRQDWSELQELVKKTVTSIIDFAKEDGEAPARAGDPTMFCDLVERVCSVVLARPIAVTNGILPMLVKWTDSRHQEKVFASIRSLRWLTSINDQCLASWIVSGWINNQVVNEGALDRIENLARDLSVGHDAQVDIAQILSSLCVETPLQPPADTELVPVGSGRIVPGERGEADLLGIESSARGSEESPGDEDGITGENMITVLFSAPLVHAGQDQTLLAFPKLNFSAEKEHMWDCVKEAKRDIELSFDAATHQRLLATITKGCTCLHYSGHGHQQYMPFENESGFTHWFPVENFKALLDREGGPPFKFVFVSACHSELAGTAFAEAGVPHVVCCQQEYELADTAALEFTRQFYLALIVGRTVKEAFQQGCKAVRFTPTLRDGNVEMEKFVLLPRDGNHDVAIFDGARPVDGRVFGRRPRQSNTLEDDHPSPPPPQYFLGREVLSYRVLKGILDKRLVSVVGEYGIGRSSLVRFLCHYINERASTMPFTRIFYIRAEQGDRFRSLADRLMKKLGKKDIFECDSDLRTAICRSLRNEKALVVFDHLEYLKDPDEFNKFCSLLADILLQTEAKVLITALQPLSALNIKFEGAVEVPFALEPLNFLDTVSLFSNLSPHLHTPGERQRLLRSVLTNGAENDLLPTDPSLSGPTKKIFEILGNGIPARVTDTAHQISQRDFVTLIMQIGSSWMRNSSSAHCGRI